MARSGTTARTFHILAQLAYGRPKWAQKASRSIGCTDSAVKGWAYGTTAIPCEAARIVLDRARRRLASIDEEHAQAAEREKLELRAALGEFERLAKSVGIG